MPKLSGEFIKGIPNFSLFGSAGGTPFNTVEMSDAMRWEAQTADGAMTFTYCEEGLYIFSPELAFGAFYNDEGEIEQVEINITEFLASLLKDYDFDDDDEFDRFLSLYDALDDNKDDLKVLTNLKNKASYLRQIDKETGEKRITKIDHNNAENNQYLILFNLPGQAFCLMYEKDDDLVEVSIGASNATKWGSEPEERYEPMNTIFMSRFCACDCNYLTFLDGKQPDKFNRLAKRVFRD